MVVATSTMRPHARSLRRSSASYDLTHGLHQAADGTFYHPGEQIERGSSPVRREYVAPSVSVLDANGNKVQVVGVQRWRRLAMDANGEIIQSHLYENVTVVLGEEVCSSSAALSPTFVTARSLLSRGSGQVPPDSAADLQVVFGTLSAEEDDSPWAVCGVAEVELTLNESL